MVLLKLKQNSDDANCTGVPKTRISDNDDTINDSNECRVHIKGLFCGLLFCEPRHFTLTKLILPHGAIYFSTVTLASALDFCLLQIHIFDQAARAENGDEFQAKFNWHLKDTGLEHVCIKPVAPRLNGKGKAERSHRTDKPELYRLTGYKDISKEYQESQNVLKN